ncbi:predicted protein [Nematostella vectensis]|uniref:Uncharacterized protein n=1 Tax=Nematostella vectensis TaxID=45351 RepID=A7SKW5_NEMVE|nr:predicted protein [Nematostella vectensis]|eukprot:XP_001627749.1 predicted protein [Nematostella vectensis]
MKFFIAILVVILSTIAQLSECRSAYEDFIREVEESRPAKRCLGHDEPCTDSSQCCHPFQSLCSLGGDGRRLCYIPLRYQNDEESRPAKRCLGHDEPCTDSSQCCHPFQSLCSLGGDGRRLCYIPLRYQNDEESRPAKRCLGHDEPCTDSSQCCHPFQSLCSLGGDGRRLCYIPERFQDEILHRNLSSHLIDDRSVVGMQKRIRGFH